MTTKESEQQQQQQQQQDMSRDVPESYESAVLVSYRSTGVGLYGVVLRVLGMPLEKIALFLNSTQVSGSNSQQLRQAIHLTFQDGKAGRSFLTPYKVVGPASGVAWFLQYSVMGMIFQVCDKTLAALLDVPPMYYGTQLMEDPKSDNDVKSNASTTIREAMKIILAPALAGVCESAVSNRAEVQRYFGLKQFGKLEQSLNWSPACRICGPAMLANSSRNWIMSSTTFVITPLLYRQYFPQEQKSQPSLFWFGLGINVFIGNGIAITQQALWGRALDYTVAPLMTAAAKGSSSSSAVTTVARKISYTAVIREGLQKDGYSAFITGPKWAARVLMNAPVQGTLPWFYNDILPKAETQVLNVAKSIYRSVFGSRSSSSSR